jgi:hypothetical protein
MNSKKFKKFKKKCLIFFWQSRFHIQFGVCLRKFGGSRPAGLAVKGIRTNRTKRLSQIIILYRYYIDSKMDVIGHLLPLQCHRRAVKVNDEDI